MNETYGTQTYRALWRFALEGVVAPLMDYLEERGAGPYQIAEVAVATPVRCYDIWRFGIGSGIGIGGGIGTGIGIETQEVYQMEPGKAYLIHGGDWHTFVGRVVAQVGPLTYRLASVSKVGDTNAGDVWHDLAGGDKERRKAATYMHFKGEVVLPLTIAAVEWEGQTPQEAGL